MTESTQPAGLQSVLEGFRVGISISGGSHLGSLGLTEDSVNEATRRLAEALLSRGAAVVFGHDWRPEGVMAEVFRLALDYRSAFDGPRLINYLPWPRQPSVSPEDLEQVASVLEVRRMERPENLKGDQDPAVLQAVALTQLRRVLADVCSARICLGGKLSEFEGTMPGVMEEAWLTLRAAKEGKDQGGKALYVSALLGGVAAALIEALEGGTWDERLGLPAPERRERLAGSVSREMPDFVREQGMRLIVEGNGLDKKENRALFHASDLETVVILVLRGLSRLAERRRERE
ncbi:MAG TPA: hypothetical protein VMN36_11665 [Verrucomicrobiales bacterium]|nr:hypothetical protein [Verrucomicrobiales bacterium]